MIKTTRVLDPDKLSSYDDFRDYVKTRVDMKRLESGCDSPWFLVGYLEEWLVQELVAKAALKGKAVA